MLATNETIRGVNPLDWVLLLLLPLPARLLNCIDPVIKPPCSPTGLFLLASPGDTSGAGTGVYSGVKVLSH